MPWSKRRHEVIELVFSINRYLIGAHAANFLDWQRDATVSAGCEHGARRARHRRWHRRNSGDYCSDLEEVVWVSRTPPFCGTPRRLKVRQLLCTWYKVTPSVE